MSQVSDLLELAPKYFDDQREIITYPAQKLTDIYGYQYLVKGEPTLISGSIHKESFQEENVFGLYEGAKYILSTELDLPLGLIVEWENELWAISHETSFNKVMDLHHYVLHSLYGYYKEFIIDQDAQANRILGSNSMRYLLTMESEIPLIPSLFKPTLEKYISIDIYTTQTLSLPYRNADNFIEQNKRDYVRFLALGLDTNELQSFIFKFNEPFPMFGITNFPHWKEEKRYTKEFDLKANLWSCDIEINYNITTTNKLEDEKLIKHLGMMLNPV